MADLNYVLFTKRFPEPAAEPAGIEAQEAYWVATGLIGWIAWVGASLVGIALGNSIPVAWGLGFAGILALLGIMSSLVNSRLRAVSVGVAGMAAVASYALPLKLNILVAIATAVAVCLLLQRPETVKPVQGNTV